MGGGGWWWVVLGDAYSRDRSRRDGTSFDTCFTGEGGDQWGEGTNQFIRHPSAGRQAFHCGVPIGHTPPCYKKVKQKNNGSMRKEYSEGGVGRGVPFPRHGTHGSRPAIDADTICERGSFGHIVELV